MIGTLKAAFVQGMLDRDEFGQRLGQAFAAPTHADLAAVTADLPAGLAAASPPKPAQVQSEGRVRRPGLVLAVGTVLYASVWPVVLALPTSGPDHESAGTGPLVILTFYYMIFLFVAGAMLVDTWQWKRSRKQLPPGQHPARAVSHPGACHRPARAGSLLRPVTVTGTSPRRPEAVVGGLAPRRR